MTYTFNIPLSAVPAEILTGDVYFIEYSLVSQTNYLGNLAKKIKIHLNV